MLPAYCTQLFAIPMISKAPNVDAYLAELPADRRPVIEKLRSLCQQHLHGCEESIEYGMPVYKRNGEMELAFASQKQYVSLYGIRKEVQAEFRSALPAANAGKGCIRFTKPDKIDFEALQQMIVRNAKLKSEPAS